MKKIIIFLVCLFSVITFSSVKTNASSPLDTILRYELEISTRDDGSLDILYTINWMVLDSTSEGPLTWVKIGIANKYVDEITKLSSNIEEIGYYGVGGAFIRIDLDKKYYAGDVVKMVFSIHQRRVYDILDGNIVSYRFTPGWFNEIEVKKILVSWNKSNVLSADGLLGDNNYVWEDKLEMGEKLHLEVTYDVNSFSSIDINEKSSNSSGSFWSTDVIVFVSFIAAATIFIVLVIFAGKRAAYCDYDLNRGFYGRRYRYGRRNSDMGYLGNGKRIIYPRSRRGSGGGGGRSCACACACACAGGGRAGCSRKDFYNPGFKIDEFLEKYKDESISKE